jgi:squalene-hopene/tetraprenyl-beta-curcumene cyclase
MLKPLEDLFMKLGTLVVSICCGCFAASLHAQHFPASWNEKAAAAYLDQRIAWWMDWPSAARDHETFCVSCHTAVPYAVARPSLRTGAAAQTPSALERRLLDNVTRRVRMWKEVEPFYPTKKEADPKTVESRGTESILNALILARYAATGGELSPDVHKAFENMWSEQIKSGDARGAWPWLQFHNSPWEGDSQYYGSALAAIAIGIAPGDYHSTPEIRDGLKLLSEYLVREQASQIPYHRVMLLWASAKLPGLLSGAQQKSIAEEILAKQQDDGGFSLSSLVGGWKRRDNTPLETKSDGYATGLVLFALQQAGTPRMQPRIQRGVEWLTSNQQTAGNWLAWSLNKQRDPASDAGHFMGDAATAYAVLALTNAK